MNDIRVMVALMLVLVWGIGWFSGILLRLASRHCVVVVHPMIIGLVIALLSGLFVGFILSADWFGPVKEGSQ